MSVVINSFLKSIAVTVVVIVASVGTAFVINPNAIFVPQHQFDFELTDVSADVNIGSIDIIEYGSFPQGLKVVLFLEVATQINLSSTYQLFIVAKTPNDDIAHIYNNDVSNGAEKNYQSEVTINGNRLEVSFSMDRFISNSYMVGLEARALAFTSEDTTPPARDNPLKTRFLGLI
ncbi:MAG: hypothetical protein ACXAC8_14390 [Candidatus Hodarchaeales archaeon]|jgi:hypothetical protein